MTENSVQTEQATINLNELNKAFADVSFMLNCILTHQTDNKDTENSRFKWLSDEASKLADIAMQHYKQGVQLAERN